MGRSITPHRGGRLPESTFECKMRDGCVIQTVPARLPVGLWREVFNSDAAIYGGSNRGNFAADI
jgi:hypothetical protein